MANTFEVLGTYGSGKTKATILVYETRRGDFWYCVEGSQNVNRTPVELTRGVNVEELPDTDYFHWSRPINSLEELTEAVEY